MERKPRLDVKPVPVEKPLDVTTATPGVKTGSAGAAQQGSGNTNTPAPGTIRRADVSRQGPAARDRDVTSDRASTRRGKTETQSPTIAAPPPPPPPSTSGTPAPQSNQPAGNSAKVVRRVPASGAAEAAKAGDSGKDVRRGDAAKRDRAKTAAERAKEAEDKQAD